LDDIKESTYQFIRSEAANRSNLYYIADVFENTQETVYNDGGHLTPVGNRIVAEKMVDIITPNDPTPVYSPA
jgi:lysophospholipase L1-like esterase